MSRTLYSQLATKLQAVANCRKSGNKEWEGTHTDDIERLVSDHMPSGSGIDSGTKFDWSRSKPDRLVFNTAFHHMNDGGFYDGWTEHDVIVTPSLSNGIELRITGRNRRDIKEYLHETFYSALVTES